MYNDKKPWGTYAWQIAKDDGVATTEVLRQRIFGTGVTGLFTDPKILWHQMRFADIQKFYTARAQLLKTGLIVLSKNEDCGKYGIQDVYRTKYWHAVKFGNKPAVTCEEAAIEEDITQNISPTIEEQLVANPQLGPAPMKPRVKQWQPTVAERKKTKGAKTREEAQAMLAEANKPKSALGWLDEL